MIYTNNCQYSGSKDISKLLILREAVSASRVELVYLNTYSTYFTFGINFKDDAQHEEFSKYYYLLSTPITEKTRKLKLKRKVAKWWRKVCSKVLN